MNVGELLEAKGREVHTIPAVVTVEAAIRRMNESAVHSLVVLDGDGISGIFTERDALAELARYGAAGLGHTIDAAMTWHPLFASEEMSVEEVCALMQRHKIRHLPVMGGEQLVGLVSLQDALACQVEVSQREAKRLQAYIIDNFGA